MAVFIDIDLHNHLTSIPLSKLEPELGVSALLGTVDVAKNEVEILSSIHFPKIAEKPNGSIIPDGVLNQLKSLNYILPYSLQIVGLVFHLEEEISSFTLQKIATQIEGLSKILTIGCVHNKSMNYYSVSKDKPQKLKVQNKKLKIEKLVSLIHTIEFETSKEILKDISEIKKTMLSNLNEYWGSITLNKDSNSEFISIVTEISQLSRIIEVTVPCDDKKLTPQTKKGNVFMAFDLHINLYPLKSQMKKKLSELYPIFNNALTQDLIIKLQRSVFDEVNEVLIPPQKIPLKFSGLELNTYLANNNPSKFEYDLCTSLIYHAKVIAGSGNDLQARMLLRDLKIYFHELGDKEKMQQIDETISEIC